MEFNCEPQKNFIAEIFPESLYSLNVLQNFLKNLQAGGEHSIFVQILEVTKPSKAE